MLELSRWQFGITTVYHFIFVPLTLSLSYLVAIMQTLWRVKRDDVYLRMTKFFGKMANARYRGQKVVVCSPDYSDAAKFADQWLAPAPGTDGALAMACSPSGCSPAWCTCSARRSAT